MRGRSGWRTRTRPSAPERMKTSNSSASRYWGRPLQGQLRPKAGATGTGGDGHRQRAGAGDRVGDKLLADAANGPAALGQRDGGGPGRRQVGRRLLYPVFLCRFEAWHASSTNVRALQRGPLHQLTVNPDLPLAGLQFLRWAMRHREPSLRRPNRAPAHEV
jgi:hypothetical protein